MRFFGHPVHPMLVHFPVAFFTLAVVAYAANALGFASPAHSVATFANVVGLVMTLPAAIAGLLEWRTIAEGSAALRVATTHMLLMLSAWALFAVALILPLVKNLSASGLRLPPRFAPWLDLGC